VFDILVVTISLFLAFYIRLDTINFVFQLDVFLTLLISVITTIIIFAARGLYNTFTRRVSIEAALSIILGSGISCIILLLSILLFKLDIPRSIPIIYGMILCNFATSIRFFIRAVGRDIDQKIRKNVTIYGAGPSGIQFMDALTSSSNYRVCQFIDDNPEMQGQTLAGIPIESFDNAKKRFKILEIDTLLITISSGAEIIRQRLLDTLSQYQIEVKTIPSITNVISNASNIVKLNDLNIEDLLGREPMITDSKLMVQSLLNKTILVTGAGGSIGSELCRQIYKWSPKRLILLDVSEFAIYTLLNELEEKKTNVKIDILPLIGSVQDNDFVKKIMNQFSIDTIYHAAAYKHVPLMEKNVMQCIANNVFGTLNLVKSAISSEVNNFILVSTDKAVKPTNFMGASKRFAELICQTWPSNKTKTKFSIVRFGNVLGSSGSVVPLFKNQIKHGGPITLTHPEVTRYFMSIPEAAQLLIEAGSMEQNDGVFVLDMGDPIKILELAKKMIVLSGLKPVMSCDKPFNSNEIHINITGLRPGEKMYEELSYSENLIGTNHPRILKTKEEPMQIAELNDILVKIYDAINDNDYTKLYKIISFVLDEVSDIKNSKDIFVSHSKKIKNKPTLFNIKK